MKMVTIIKKEKWRGTMVMLFLLCTICGVKGEEPSAKLILCSKDGTKVAYLLTERPKISFAEDNLVIKTYSFYAEYPLTGIQKLSYEGVSSMGINDIISDAVSFSIQDGDVVVLYNISPGQQISVYGIDGKMYMRQISTDAKNTRISLSMLPSGTYVIKAKGLSFKIMKL